MDRRKLIYNILLGTSVLAFFFMGIVCMLSAFRGYLVIPMGLAVTVVVLCVVLGVAANMLSPKKEKQE